MEYKYKRLDESKGRVIVKVSFGDFYVITKCGSIDWLIHELNTTLSKYKKQGVNKDNLYIRFVEKVHKLDFKKGVIEVLYQSDNGYDLLKKELELLIEHYGKRNCMNSNNIPYIPKTIHANKGSNWLKQNEYLNFMKLLKNYEY